MNTVDPKEIQNFSKDSAHWWDMDGAFAPLHRLNPVRITYIKQQICAHFGRDAKSFSALSGLRVLDVGCGGGLVCEPMARLGADVTGIDADAQGIAVAQEHARSSKLNITYHAQATDELKTSKKTYDVVLALEIIEHVAQPATFVQDCFDLCVPGGMVIFSTLNRTPKSYALGILAAEHILRWVPRGTHDWKKFVKPSELSRYVRDVGGTMVDICGLTYSPFQQKFSLDPRDMAVNYLMACQKPV